MGGCPRRPPALASAPTRPEASAQPYKTHSNNNNNNNNNNDNNASSS